jgi:hypothetical protein
LELESNFFAKLPFPFFSFKLISIENSEYSKTEHLSIGEWLIDIPVFPIRLNEFVIDRLNWAFLTGNLRAIISEFSV